MPYTLSHQTPSLGFVAWSGTSISYDGVIYAIADGNTDKKFIYWVFTSPNVFLTSITQPSITEKDCIVFVNNGGVATSILEASVIDGSLIVAGTVHATAITAGSITATQISSHSITADRMLVTDLSALNANMGAIDAGSFTLNGDGYIRGGQTAYATDTGFWLGKTDGKYKFSLGSPTIGLTWDGDALNIGSGVIIAGKTASEVAAATRNVFKGDWASGVSYIVGDSVLFDGSGWSCTTNHTAALVNQPPIYPISSNTWWVLFAAKGDGTPGPQGIDYDVNIESTNGTVFRVGENTQTTLIARVFKNGVDVTSEIPASKFVWTRVSIDPQSAPNDDATWNALYATGYPQIAVSVDDVFAKATFHCYITD